MFDEFSYASPKQAEEVTMFSPNIIDVHKYEEDKLELTGIYRFPLDDLETDEKGAPQLERKKQLSPQGSQLQRETSQSMPDDNHPQPHSSELAMLADDRNMGEPQNSQLRPQGSQLQRRTSQSMRDVSHPQPHPHVLAMPTVDRNMEETQDSQLKRKSSQLRRQSSQTHPRELAMPAADENLIGEPETTSRGTERTGSDVQNLKRTPRRTRSSGTLSLDASGKPILTMENDQKPLRRSSSDSLSSPQRTRSRTQSLVFDTIFPPVTTEYARGQDTLIQKIDPLTGETRYAGYTVPQSLSVDVVSPTRRSPASRSHDQQKSPIHASPDTSLRRVGSFSQKSLSPSFSPLQRSNSAF